MLLISTHRMFKRYKVVSIASAKYKGKINILSTCENCKVFSMLLVIFS